MKNGTVQLEAFESKVLAGNPLGDPVLRKLPVYLPPSYYTSSMEYPVVFCLAGYTGGARSWLNFQAWIPSIDERADWLIDQGMSEMILVFPDCFTMLGGSQYLDSIAVGAYRSYLIGEILPFVEKKFRVKRDRRFRGVMGKSSGGYGAITIAMEHQDLFSAVACHSGDMYFEYCYLSEFPIACRRLRQLGGLNGFFEKFNELTRSGKDHHAVLDAVAMSACYSPNPNAPHLIDLPFDLTTGELQVDVWGRWKEKDPVEMIRKNPVCLKNFGYIYTDCGTRDEFALDAGARIFAAELDKHQIPHTHEEFDDGHFNIQYRYDVSLKAIAAYFQSQ
jgi:enterochelin esterase family protein